MADSIIGALRVVLGLDTAAFSSGAKEAQSTLDGLASTFKKAIATLGVAAIGAEFVSSVKGIIDVADQLEKASQKFGVPVEQLSALKYAAELADVGFEQLSKGMGRLSTAILQGATNPASDAAKEFNALGISVGSSGKITKDTITVFGDVADKFANMQDGATKTALAIKLFGKSGADLIPLLNEGRDGIKRMTDEAHSLGIVISAETAAKAEQFNDTLKKIHAASTSLALLAAKSLLPQLQKIADLFIANAREGSAFKSIMSNLITEYDIEAIQRIVLNWQNFVRLLIGLKTFAFSLKPVSQAVDDLSRVLDENAAKVKALENSFLSLGKAGAFDALENLPELTAKVSRGMGGIDESALKAKDAIDKFIESQTKAIAGVNAQAASVGMAIGFHEKLRITMEAEAIAAANHTTMTTAQSAAIQDLGNKAAGAAMALAGANLTQEFLSPWDQYAQKIRDIDLLLKNNAINSKTAADAAAAAWGKALKTTGDVLATAAGQFSDFFLQFSKGNETMFAIHKAFAISQAIINSFVAFTAALRLPLPPPLPQIAAAAVLAAGLAMVAKIVAEKPPAAAKGGSFMVPGGSMSVDTKLVPMALAPGERVDVTPAGQAGRTASGVLVVNPIQPKDFFTGDTVREMVLSIDQWMRDGGSGVRFARG